MLQLKQTLHVTYKRVQHTRSTQPDLCQPLLLQQLYGLSVFKREPITCASQFLAYITDTIQYSEYVKVFAEWNSFPV